MTADNTSASAVGFLSHTSRADRSTRSNGRSTLRLLNIEIIRHRYNQPFKRLRRPSLLDMVNCIQYCGIILA